MRKSKRTGIGVSRRHFSIGLSYASLGMAAQTLLAEDRQDLSISKRLPGKAKSIIFLFMSGAPSQVDTFDPKPMLNRLSGQECTPIHRGAGTAYQEGRLKKTSCAALGLSKSMGNQVWRFLRYCQIYPNSPTIYVSSGQCHIAIRYMGLASV